MKISGDWSVGLFDIHGKECSFRGYRRQPIYNVAANNVGNNKLSWSFDGSPAWVIKESGLVVASLMNGDERIFNFAPHFVSRRNTLQVIGRTTVTCPDCGHKHTCGAKP